MEFLESLYSADGLQNILATGGIWLVFAIIFAETGLLVGFFLPGDSLLITCGLLAAATPTRPAIFDITEVIIMISSAAFIGDQLGYFLGQTPLANNLTKILVVIFLIFTVPIGINLFKKFRTKKSLNIAPKADINNQS